MNAEKNFQNSLRNYISEQPEITETKPENGNYFSIDVLIDYPKYLTNHSYLMVTMDLFGLIVIINLHVVKVTMNLLVLMVITGLFECDGNH